MWQATGWMWEYGAWGKANSARRWEPVLSLLVVWQDFHHEVRTRHILREKGEAYE